MLDVVVSLEVKQCLGDLSGKVGGINLDGGDVRGIAASEHAHAGVGRERLPEVRHQCGDAGRTAQFLTCEGEAYHGVTPTQCSRAAWC